jgi:hypothetical protein
MFESYVQKTRRFWILRPFSRVITHIFGVLVGFTKTVIDNTCLTVTNKNSFFSCFMDIFIIYCARFWGTRAIYDDRKIRYMFESYDQKLVVFAFYHHFHELLPTVLGLQGDLNGP